MPYRIEYASSARAGCKGPKPCSGTKIGKGELRLGTIVKIKDNDAVQWRHWGCTTEKVLSNIIKDADEKPEELDGFEDLKEEDQDKIRKAFEEGHVADEDIPETARKTEGEEGEKPKKKRAPAKKKVAKKDEEEEEEEEEEKPKKKAPAKRKAPAKKKKKEESEEEDERSAEESAGSEAEASFSDDDEKPKKKKKTAPKKAPAKNKASGSKKKAKADEEDEEEDEE